ncbi:death-associated inhibitor of apoptosis 1-like [Megalopta genalis]|uniref:death-associated inhibitor of apoptosis 1-like n=1 Tax=Megalopta genalis TaxID=115081 RepID=UPI003FD202AF
MRREEEEEEEEEEEDAEDCDCNQRLSITVPSARSASFGSSSWKKEIMMDYRREEDRLRSFEFWPIEYIQPEELAAAGFYYLGQDDFVACFACDIELHRWQHNDRAMSEHHFWSRNCPYVLGENCGNVPIDAHPTIMSISSSRSGVDECGIYDYTMDEKRYV